MKDFSIDVTPFDPKEVAPSFLKDKTHALYLQALPYVGKLVVLKSHPEITMTVHSIRVKLEDLYYGSSFRRPNVEFGCMRFCKSSQRFVEQFFSIHCLELKEEQQLMVTHQR